MKSPGATPLAILCGLLALASIPLWDEVSGWLPVLVVACAGGRILGLWRGWPLLSFPWRLAILALAGGAIYLQHHTFFAVAPGFGILLALVSLKMLETRSARDFSVLILLGYFLALCALFFSQEFSRWLYLMTLLVLLTATAIIGHNGLPPGRWRRGFGLAGAMLAQALPLAAILFLLVPRPAADLRLFPGSSSLGVAAMSEHMYPGSIAGMAAQTGRAFRAAFPNTTSFPSPPYYWRGAVLWAGDGLDWQKGPRLRTEPRAAGAHGPAIRQYITLEPHGQHWLFALDRPISAVKDANYEPGGALHSERPVNGFTSYEVISQPENTEAELLPDQAAAALAKPARISPDVQRLADSFRRGARSDAQIVQRALDYFRAGNFTYSYAPGAYASNELDDFLFRRRAGFCEHYAGAFATLMRIAGLPSRVVLGYLGGEESHYGRYLIVNQSDAHAWCEVWLRGRGWMRVDPTSAAAPDRINSGLYNYLASQSTVTAAPGGAGFGGWYSYPWLREIRLVWDGLTYQWDLHVLTFDRENQQDFISLLGLGFWHFGELLSGALLLFTAVLAALCLWIARNHSHTRDRAQVLYARFCRKLRRAGLPRVPAEAPLSFAQRASRHFPTAAPQLQTFAQLYIAHRYSPKAPPLPSLIAALHSIPHLQRNPASTLSVP